MLTADGLLQTDPAEMADALPPEAWAVHAAGEGSKGVRLYDWARIALPWVVDGNFKRWVLIRCNPYTDQRACHQATGWGKSGVACD